MRRYIVHAHAELRQPYYLRGSLKLYQCVTSIELEKGNEQKLPCCWTAAKFGHQILPIQGSIHRIDYQGHVNGGSIVSGLDFDPIWPFWVWINTKINHLCICVIVCSYRIAIFWKYLSKNQHREFGNFGLWEISS